MQMLVSGTSAVCTAARAFGKHKLCLVKHLFVFVDVGVGLSERDPRHFFQVLHGRDRLDERGDSFSDEGKRVVFGVTFHQLLNHLH